MFERLWFLMLGSVFLCVCAMPVEAASSSPQLEAALVSVRALSRQQQWSQVATQAQDAIQSAKAEQFPVQYAQLHVYLGIALHQQGYRSLAFSAFERALIWNPRVSLPPDVSSGVQNLFASAQKQKQGSTATATTQKSETSSTIASTQPESTRVHVGWIIGWVSVAVSAAALGLGFAAGGNAYTNAQESASLAKEARSKGFSQLSTDPIVTHVHANAVMYGTMANVSYAIAGAMALGATGFFLWAILSRPRVSKKTVQMNSIPTVPQTEQNVVVLSVP